MSGNFFSRLVPSSFKLSAACVATIGALAACGGGSNLPAFLTLDGNQPIVIAHRGASAYYPEETKEAYTLAISMGADVIEPDLVMTKDGVLIARHDVTLATSTDVASHPEFASRKRAGENGDGEAVAADWFTADFTLAEIKTLRAKSPSYELAKVYNGLFQVITFQEVLDLIKAKAADTGRTIAVYPETKNPSYHYNLWKSGALPARLEDVLVKMIKDNGLNSKTAPIYVQSFEPGSLQYMRTIGSQVKQMQLIDAYDVDYKAGKLIYGTAPGNLVYSQPTDWKLAGRKELFDVMLTPQGLADIKQYADGIGAWKPMVIPVKCQLDAKGDCKDLDGNGTFDGYPDAEPQAPTSLVADAHKAGLFVHEYTFKRGKSDYNTTFDARNDPLSEYLQHFRLGVDGVFSDAADIAIAARAAYLREMGR
ncbi:glycerophosphodiester phosphodiesterase family protein [Noviherbaspirillum galbum]|uniref:glycerophosphodiester phosphodiesterase n=1 Tax=Noviherbaspirillum galbum TaxID=2709383 RepID=A0A6B3SZG1_9BURK|nr:glycerophosphodiester phosphodiesterase family protein [Noviherbaspirillum galbum]NEX64059.1 glycerophosphodiester phosphodiesterase [Noviherbaspirillum galbum]